jgi:NADH pyrophosphatase NudC (nudix superfamily)
MGENPAAALKREAIEELGLDEIKVALVASYTWETKIESELVYMFFGRYNKIITIADKEEIDEGKYWKIKKIKENLNKGIFTPNFEYEFDILMKGILK